MVILPHVAYFRTNIDEDVFAVAAAFEAEIPGHVHADIVEVELPLVVGEVGKRGGPRGIEEAVGGFVAALDGAIVEAQQGVSCHGDVAFCS